MEEKANSGDHLTLYTGGNRAMNQGMNLHIQAKGRGKFCIFGCSPFGPQQDINREKSEIERKLTFLYKSGDPTWINSSVLPDIALKSSLQLT